MANKRQQRRRAAEFIKPFRVKPGSKVNLAKDFDPRFKAGVKKKKEGVALLETGIELLSRVSGSSRGSGQVGRAGGAAGARRCGQGRHDPPRDERRQSTGRPGPQLQGSIVRGARPRLPMALRAAPAGTRRDRDLQPLALRGGPRRSRPPREPRPPEDPRAMQEGGCVQAALRGDQQLGALPDRERLPDREAVPQPVQGGAAHALPATNRPSRSQLEVLRRRRQGARVLG